MLRRKRVQEESAKELNEIESSSTEVATDKKRKRLLKRKKSVDIKKLESLVFGGDDDFLERLRDPKEEPTSASDDEKPDEIAIEQIEVVSAKVEKQPAWVDEDDEAEITIKGRKATRTTLLENGQTVKGSQYAQKLKQSFEKSVGGTATPKWAIKKERTKKKTASDEEEDSEDDDYDLTRRTGNYIGSSVNLPKNTLRFKRICDLTKYNQVKTRVNTTEFLRRAQILLVSGYTQRLMLYQVDGKENPLLQTVHFDHFPIETAHFSADGERVLVGSMMHRHFFYYDMNSDKTVRISKIRGLDGHFMGKFCVSPDNAVLAFAGPFGTIDLLSAKTYDFITTLSMNGFIRAMCFSSLGDYLYTHGDDGEVYIWDIRQRTCSKRFFDDGCIKGTAISVSPKDTYVACGSNSGIVNLYDSNTIMNTDRPTPLKTIKNLTTWVSNLRFNEANEMLSYFSSEKENAAKMFHLSSRSTFNNFPADRERMGKVCSMDVSVNSGYLCCGNDKGQAFLYRLFHYENY